MKNNLASRIIFELSEEKEGLTNSEIIKKIGNKKIFPQNINYYLKDLLKFKIISKHGNKYKLIRKTFLVNGIAVVEFEDKLLILECPYFGTACDGCNNEQGKCRFIENLPDCIKNSFEENGKSD